jgi:beta-glucanase (GH16 family)
MTDKQYIPQSAGKIILSHWSNGNPLWSGGPPEVDAKMTVSYVHAYFNSSDPARKKDHANRCKDISANNAICQIPDQVGPPKTGQVHFFSQDTTADKVKNQTVYAKEKGSAAVGSGAGRSSVVLVSALLVGCLFGWF